MLPPAGGELALNAERGAAANKVKHLIADEDNPNLKLRVYITGGGCSGFQYGFTFDDQVNEGDMTIEKQGVGLVVDPMSLQYLVGGSVDYTEGLEGSRFIVTNPNAKSTCGFGKLQRQRYVITHFLLPLILPAG
ncbi:iron-sulfur cluster insertion protein ErpA [Klebsiella pneumoniae]|uniref:iron-sulfur cluster insertion protein ErpA n=1 Tax=Klebsiella pneumoniae TaxID=573 RepID=UPI00300B0431